MSEHIPTIGGPIPRHRFDIRIQRGADCEIEVVIIERDYETGARCAADVASLDHWDSVPGAVQAFMRDRLTTPAEGRED